MKTLYHLIEKGDEQIFDEFIQKNATNYWKKCDLSQCQM